MTVTFYIDGTYSFVIKSEPISLLILKMARKEKGSRIPNKTKVD